MEVIFKFAIGQNVKTNIGVVGIVSEAMVSAGSICTYNVKWVDNTGSGNNQWLYAEELTAI